MHKISMVDSKELVEKMKKIERKILTFQYLEDFCSRRSNKESNKKASKEALEMIRKILREIKEEGLYFPEPNNFKERLESLFKKKVWSVKYKKGKKPKNENGENNKDLLKKQIRALI